MGLILTRLNGSNPSRQVIRGGGSTSTSGNHQGTQKLRSPDSSPPPKIRFPHPSLSPSPLLLLSRQATIILAFSPLPTVLRPKQNRRIQKHIHPCIFVYLDSCFHNWESQESLLGEGVSKFSSSWRQWERGLKYFGRAEEKRRLDKTTTYYLQNGHFHLYI